MKKLISFCIVTALLFVLAVPAFAQTRAAYHYPTGVYTLHAQMTPEVDTNFCLNVASNHQVGQNVNVNIYSSTGDLDQRWNYKLCNDGNYRICSMLNQNYALNVYYPNTGGARPNCDIMLWASNLYDSALYYYSGSSDGSVFTGGIELAHYPNYWLTAASLSQSANVYWLNGTRNSTESMLWFPS